MSHFIETPSGLIVRRSSVAAIETRPEASTPPGRPCRLYLSDVFTSGGQAGPAPVCLDISKEDRAHLRAKLV